ncbi:MAG TPA: hypothetical protein VIJ87_04880 [Pyrinomonadaceae bacterium]
MAVPRLADFTPEQGVEIFDLSAATDVAVGDLFVIVDVSDTTGDGNGTTKKITGATVATGLQLISAFPRVKRLGTQHSISSTTGTVVSDLTMALEIGTFLFTYTLLVRSATATVGPMVGVNFTGTGNPRQIAYWADNTAALTDETYGMSNQGSKSFGFIAGMADSTKSTTAPAMGSTVGVKTTATDTLMIVQGIIIVTVAGNLELYHSSETASATSVEVGSSLMVNKTG